jgi:hypothetical protein
MIATFILSVLVALAVLVHYEILYRLSLVLPKLQMKHRYRMLVGIFGALTAHFIEVWVFAFGYYFMLRRGDFGEFIGDFDGSVLDCVYYSFTTYTSLGIGDIEPLGEVRFVTGVETLTGLVLIAWTASYLYIEMTRFWSTR